MKRYTSISHVDRIHMGDTSQQQGSHTVATRQMPGDYDRVAAAEGWERHDRGTAPPQDDRGTGRV